MSFFLLEINRWSKQLDLDETDIPRPCVPSSQKKQCLARFDACMTRHMVRHKQFTTTLIDEDSRFKTYGVYFHGISKHFDGLMRFLYRKKEDQVSVYFHFLDRNGQYLRIEGMQMYNQVFKSAFLNPSTHNNSVKWLLNVENGSVCLQICYYSAFRENLITDMDQGMVFKPKNIILDLYHNFVEPIIPVFQRAYKINFPPERKNEIDEDIPKLVENVIRYTKMMTTKINLSSAAVQSQVTKVSQLKQRQQSTRKLFDRKIQLTEELIKPFELFGIAKCLRSTRKVSKTFHQFNISPSEEKQLLSVLTLDGSAAAQKPTASHQNILNFINILGDNPQDMKTYPLNLGGFSFIESAEITFKYIDSFSSNKNEAPTNRPPQQRRVAIKRENRAHGKNLHEFKILTEMRNSINPLFPKYLIPMNLEKKNKHDQKPLLMMELFPDGNMIEFLRNRRKCISLLSKLYLLYSVSTALRHLESYKIVHLDIKPNNVMIAPGLQVKIIDFGEAFHPTVWKEDKTYRPGFTFPYCPPEFSSGVKHGSFTNKADVYSFGVMMFEVIFGRVPFEYRERMFLAPETSDLCGDPIVIRLLNWMISRCLSKNPELRPELDWISVILRLCLEFVT